ncbi:MAG: RNA degradosome polyphosphate kinase, partial [Burkholderiales bacterium PBB4]
MSLLRKLFPRPATSGEPLSLLDRDHSILAFNARVLDWAIRDDVPLIERLRYLCIVSSNLDEFFEVRAEPHLNAHRAQDTKGDFTVRSFEWLSDAVHRMVDQQYTLFNEKIMPAFDKQGIKIISHGDRNPAQRL